MILSEIKDKYNQAIGQRDNIKNNLSIELAKLKSLDELEKNIDLAAVILQETATEMQESLRWHISDIVQTAIDAVFPDMYEFKIDFIIKNNRTNCDIYLEKDGKKIDPMNSSGGGLIDIVSLALRMSAWSLGKTDNLIIMDEPLKFLSEDLKPLAGEIIQTLSKKLNLQLIIVTHDKFLIDVADKVFKVKLKNNISYVNDYNKV